MDPEVGNKCHLLALPPELRNRIYDFVFADEAPPAIDVNEIDLHWPSAALSGTCYQLHNETIKMMRAAAVQFTTHHICIIEMGPFLESDTYRARLLERFSGTSYSSIKLQGLELRVGNGESRSARIVMSDGVYVRRAPTKAASSDPVIHQEHKPFLGVFALSIREDLPRLTAHRWREHCREMDIGEGQKDFEDPRTWDIKDIVHLMYTLQDAGFY
ncbi:hypothetical protein LTR56_014410 [Elasticomyces elasticus]|nr:hypothetical protein LTR22_020563 [Elasticomyces elasticus]KAK3636034.1 hypothetical protein LTR56_014410 [Elasticomyces elasticus]KAK4916677.1 hypothetical protein LTR49_015375 [Elasticomyces elasticus]KAK5754951.1 hypothetical protein LTS12_014984 [Elasticomyces elasticus]